MTSPLAQEIRQQLVQYLSGEMSLQELSSWLGPIVMTVRQEEDQSAADLAFEIELRLAEYSNGDWTEDELRDMFQQLVASPSAAQSG